MGTYENHSFDRYGNNRISSRLQILAILARLHAAAAPPGSRIRLTPALYARRGAYIAAYSLIAAPEPQFHPLNTQVKVFPTPLEAEWRDYWLSQLDSD